ncbi:MAG TPA: amino acid adenylation domain-containing protein, partial [Candidatus Kapabacteria bacterium]|nr:amino acid adenylation domain-containing protein [Candidatus Kapabacteria bacterium]
MEKLDPQDIQDIYALTPLQEGMLFHYLKEPESGLYFEQLSLEISGEIDVRHFENAWNAVIETNEMLRAVFRWEKLEKPSQVILKKHPGKVAFYDLSDMDTGQKKTALAGIKKKDRREIFDLQRVPFRVILCKLEKTKYEVIISNHHILYDGWSNGIILKEFFRAYHGFLKGEPAIKLPAKTPFKEFVKWTRNQDRNRQEQFWREYLAGIDTPTVLPIKRTKLGEIKEEDSFSFYLEEEIRDKLDIFVKNNRITPAPVFYTAWGIVLEKYCGSEDIIFGTTVSGRSGAVKGIEDMVGLFINTIPLRVQTPPGVKMMNILSGIENAFKIREEFENTALPDIRDYSTVTGNEPLFDTIVSIENYPLDSRLITGDSLLTVNSYSIGEMTHYALTVVIMPVNEIEIKFSFQRESIEKETVENLAGHFKIIMQKLVENPEMKFSQLEILSAAEKNRILYEFNNTGAEYPVDKTIHQLFVEQVEKSPDRIAVMGPSISMQIYLQISYRHLHTQSDRLAGLLIEKNVLRDNIAAIMMERSLEMITGILGILKSGGAYLPIDPDYPSERINYMIKDSGTTILLTGYEQDKITDCQLSIVNCQLLMSPPQAPFHHSSFIVRHANQLAYIIYTSGSTGKPKGVLVEHRSVVNLICHQDRYFNIKRSDRILLFSSICFDASVEQLFIAFSSGAVSVVIDKNTLQDMEKFDQFISRHLVSHIHAVPSFLSNMYLKRPSHLKRVVAGGDVCPTSLAEKWHANFNFYNEYGPTETTVTSIEILIKDPNAFLFRLPVGKPVGNTTVYLLDRFMKPVPLGVTGELFIGGAGVARGYLNRPELTAEKFQRAGIRHASFVDGSNSNSISFSNDRLYKTGDLAR